MQGISMTAAMSCRFYSHDCKMLEDTKLVKMLLMAFPALIISSPTRVDIVSLGLGRLSMAYFVVSHSAAYACTMGRPQLMMQR